MPKCPKCGAEINQLICYVSNVTEVDAFTLDEKGEPFYDKIDEIYDESSDIEFTCPVCDKPLFHKEEEAIRFLKGEKVEVIEE